MESNKGRKPSTGSAAVSRGGGIITHTANGVIKGTKEAASAAEKGICNVGSQLSGAIKFSGQSLKRVIKKKEKS